VLGTEAEIEFGFFSVEFSGSSWSSRHALSTAPTWPGG
jgi:hypothetical protein